MTVYKYELSLTAAYFQLTIPQHAKILTFGQQEGRLFLWALVDPSALKEIRIFQTVGTGEEIDPTWFYMGTVPFHEGSFIVHVFEVPK